MLILRWEASDLMGKKEGKGLGFLDGVKADIVSVS